MITIKDYMEVVNFRITEGSEYCWKCFGTHAYNLDSWDGDFEGFSVSIVFDTQSQEVYQAEAWDYANDIVYRLLNPTYVEAFMAESRERNIDPAVAIEDDDAGPIFYTDLTEDGIFLEKVLQLVRGE